MWTVIRLALIEVEDLIQKRVFCSPLVSLRRKRDDGEDGDEAETEGRDGGGKGGDEGDDASKGKGG